MEQHLIKDIVSNVKDDHSRAFGDLWATFNSLE